MSFTLLDLVGEDAALRLLRQARPEGKPHRLGRPPAEWTCSRCGSEAHARKMPDGARLWCDSCEDFTVSVPIALSTRGAVNGGGPPAEGDSGECPSAGKTSEGT